MTEATQEELDVATIRNLVRKSVYFDTGMGQSQGTARIECYYETFCVNLQQAELDGKEFERLLSAFGETFSDESLKRGVVYKDGEGPVSAAGASTLEIFAFGKVLGLWEVVTPKERRRNPALKDVVFPGAEVGSIGIIRLPA